MTEGGKKKVNSEKGIARSEWKEFQLGDVVDIFDGPHATPKKTMTGDIFLGISNLINGRIDLAGAEYLSADDYRKWTRRVEPRENDIVFSYETKLGDAALIPSGLRFCLGRRMGLLRARNNLVDPRFLFYYYRAPVFQGVIQEHTVFGTTVDRIPLIDMPRFPICLPPLPEQRAIAGVLSSLDDKIDLLRRQDKTLEAMAEVLFRQWFVEEAGEERKEGTIADLIEFNPTRKLSKGTIAPYLEMSSLSNTAFMPNAWYDREFSSGTKFRNGDTLLARITPCLENGKTAYITFLDDNQVAWGSTEYIVMRPKEPIHPFFAYILARINDFRDYAEGCLEGSSGRQRVNIDHLMKYQMAVPDRESIMHFNSTIESFIPKLQSNAQQIRTLEALRDTLLPKLMSGEVRVDMRANDA